MYENKYVHVHAYSCGLSKIEIEQYFHVRHEQYFTYRAKANGSRFFIMDC